MIHTTQHCWAERGSVIFCFNNKHTHAPVLYIYIILIYLALELTIKDYNRINDNIYIKSQIIYFW